MERRQKTSNLIQKVVRKSLQDGISVYAAQSSFYIIFSGIPFLILLLQLLHFLPYGREDVYGFFEVLMPEYLLPLLTSILEELYSIPVNIFWMTTFLAIWGSSKAMHSICYGLDCINGIKKQRSWFQIRGWALVYTIIFALLIVFILVSTVFWRNITETIQNAVGSEFLIGLFSHWSKILFDFAVMSGFFIIMFRVFPSRKMSISHNLPGALFASLGWIVLSEIFYIYVEFFAAFSMYGSLATIVFLMFWLYFCMSLLYVGAEINEVLRRERRRQHRIEFRTREIEKDRIAKEAAEKELSMDPEGGTVKSSERVP